MLNEFHLRPFMQHSTLQIFARFAQAPSPPSLPDQVQDRLSPPVGRGVIVLCLWIVLIPALSTTSPLEADEIVPRRLFDITTEIGMPNLEENLRYATTREQQCLSDEQLFRHFPVMDHVALKDCILAPESRLADSATYRLVCSGGHGTAGAATWRIGEQRLRGTLTVKLGGKNMIFYQRVTAKPLGACAAATE